MFLILPRSPAASHSLGPSVTPGMGAKVAEIRVAMLMSVSELLFAESGTGASVGEMRGDTSSGRTVAVTSS